MKPKSKPTQAQIERTAKMLYGIGRKAFQRNGGRSIGDLAALSDAHKAGWFAVAKKYLAKK